MSYEALSDVPLTRLLKYFNLSDSAEYAPVMIEYQKKEIPACVSRNFRGKNKILIPFEQPHHTFRRCPSLL